MKYKGSSKKITELLETPNSDKQVRENMSTTALAEPDLIKQINLATGFIRERIKVSPEIGIILGTGLGDLVKEVQAKTVIPYTQIPHFPVSTVESHAGNLIFGELSSKEVMVMQGRFHFYEGYALQQVVFPVRVMRALGVQTLIVSNVSGGLNPQFTPGDIMIITDHINLLGANPLVGKNYEEWGPRFPDMSEPYNKKLIQLAETVALEERMKVQKGVYVALCGPSLETRAEYRFLRMIGADVVGMSTVPEVIVAVHAGLKVMGLSVITDACLPDALKPVNLPEIIKIAREAEPRLIKLMKKVLEKI